MRGPEDRDTEAYGWISGLRAVTGLGDMSGLYGIIKWTSKGIALARDRIYRFLSPVFELDAQGRATKLINVALTNRPALPLPPIINSEPEDTTTSMTQTQKDTDNMNKEEIAELVKQEVAAALAAAKEAANEEAAPAEKPEEMPAEKPAEEAKPAEPEAKPVEEAKNEDVHVDVFEEKKEQPEVIKAETLNSSPVIGADASEPWRKLHGQEFFTYLRQHPEAR